MPNPTDAKATAGTQASGDAHASRTDRPPFIYAFGLVVSQERKARGLRQADVAARAGLRIEHLREIEQGRANPSFVKLAHLARAGLGVPLSRLVVTAEEELLLRGD